MRHLARLLVCVVAASGCHQIAAYNDSNGDRPPDAGAVLDATAGDAPDADLAPGTCLQSLGAPPAGACRAEVEGFVTAEGGCCDRASGLTWSAISVEAMDWHQAVWDASRASSPPADAHDLGRTNDYPEVNAPCPRYCDESATAYCHGLTEGDRKDWRLPSLAELTALQSRMANGGAIPLASAGESLVVWSADSVQAGLGKTIDLETGVVVEAINKNQPRRIVCVRGGRSPADHVELLGGPAAVGAGQALPGPLRVAIRDEAGGQVNAQGVELRLEAGSGTLAGEISVPTSIVGVAELGQWTIDLDPPATVALEIRAGGLTPATHELVVGPYRHTCRLEDGDFRTAEGGCKDLLTGLVWSAPSSTLLSWDEAIWDAQSPTDNVPADAEDQGRTDDYDGTAGFTDGSTANYCHELEESDLRDWRMPTADELIAVVRFGEGAPEHFGFETDLIVHASTTSASSMNARVNLASGVTTQGGREGRSARAICVREGS